MPHEYFIGQDDPVVCVSWRRVDGHDGYVQLATINPSSTLTIPGEDTPFRGWHATLDEKAIGRLIKALHKAKRQAYPTRQP